MLYRYRRMVNYAPGVWTCCQHLKRYWSLHTSELDDHSKAESIFHYETDPSIHFFPDNQSQ